VNDPTPLGSLLRQLAAEAVAEMKDKSYRRSPVGETVGRFIDSVSYGNSPLTAESYESPLALLAVFHDDLDGVHVFCERPDLIERFLHVHWGDSAPKTRTHRWTVLNLFFKWCIERDLIASNPMRGIRRPRNPKTRNERRAYDQEQVARLIDAQSPLRDRCALGLSRLALRLNDIRELQLRDIDLVLDQIHLNHGKGGKRDVLPIKFKELRLDLGAHLAERTLEAGVDPGDEYLLYARDRRHQPMNRSTVHRWFKRCLANAGLPDSIQMHELRHTAGDHIWRTTGNMVLAQKLLRHSSPATTYGYLHPNEDDLRGGLELVDDLFHMSRSPVREDG
jgi:integrase/recombinase XerC